MNIFSFKIAICFKQNKNKKTNKTVPFPDPATKHQGPAPGSGTPNEYGAFVNLF